LGVAVGDAAGDGVRLMPFVLYVQRIVRLLNEHGEEPSVLLANPEGMLRWYIRNECADNKERCQLLLTAYDLRALVILVDGVDEAAGMRDVVEAFVHYELVPSGNRLVVTSRPEGVDLEDYRRKFVVMNLTELSQEQQRNVIQMQLQGNQFFEHLVNLAECRRDLDDRYHKTFSTETIRTEIQTIAYVRSEEKKEGEKAAAAGGAAGGSSVNGSKQDLAYGDRFATDSPAPSRSPTRASSSSPPRPRRCAPPSPRPRAKDGSHDPARRTDRCARDRGDLEPLHPSHHRHLQSCPEIRRRGRGPGRWPARRREGGRFRSGFRSGQSRG
jgi:hypothetical protein